MINLPEKEIQTIKYRIDKFCQHQINAFSPTISPAPKSVERNEIESIEKGIQYYLSKGIKQLILQKKYMGSYCDIYLHRNLEQSYLVSRNAYKISQITPEEYLPRLKNIHQKFNWEAESLELVIIQSELMPWYALGKNLIENDFYGYHFSHQNHQKQLEKSNIYNKIEQVKNSETYQTFIADKKELSGNLFRKKYEIHIIRQYDAITDFIMQDLNHYQQNLNNYKLQLDYYGKIAPLEFKPFNILKKVFQNGEELIPNDNRTFHLINDDETLMLDFENESNYETELQKAYNWYEKLSNDFEEGIMIKPIIAFAKNIAPALKVRNDNYLMMIYGIDFKDNYKRNLGKRKVDKKMNCSINDWMLNWELLKIPYKHIHSENYQLKNLVLDRILGENIENKLDTRL